MIYSIPACISIRAAAKLFLSGNMDLSYNYPIGTAEKILLEIIDLTIEEVLIIIDDNTYGNIADVKYIPQFGKLENVGKITHYFKDNGTSCADYSQLGFYLKHDIKSSLGANVKFGETHGKASASLGLVLCEQKKICPSSFTHAFYSLNKDQQTELLKKLLFRIPIIQITLKNSRLGQFNGYEPMQILQHSTMLRRGQCLRYIFKTLSTYNDTNLINRINNIVWEEDEVKNA